MLKRGFDVLASGVGLLVLSPVLVTVMALIWLEDRHSPFYWGPRIGRGGRPFSMLKFRSMTPNADRTGVDSTSADDRRITRMGHVIRRFKLDEFSQLWNVLWGTMSLVGPRPQVGRDVALYTDVERGLLEVSPGITDFSSIVFADEGDILKGSQDPDLLYQQIIRPWKSRLGLHYVAVRSFGIDVALILLTLANAVSRKPALKGTAWLLARTGASPELVAVAERSEPLRPFPPPGASEIVSNRSAQVP